MCKGKVQVNGNPPEKPTVRETLEHIRLAIEGGVEIVNVTARRAGTPFGPRTRNMQASSTSFCRK